MKAYIALDALQFAELCAGKEVVARSANDTEVHLILSDIGFDVMESAVARARHRPKTNAVGAPRTNAIADEWPKRGLR